MIGRWRSELSCFSPCEGQGRIFFLCSQGNLISVSAGVIHRNLFILRTWHWGCHKREIHHFRRDIQTNYLPQAFREFFPSPKHTAASAPACAIIMCVKIIAKPKIINSFIHSFMTSNCSCGFLFHSSDNNYCKQNQNWIPVKLLLKHSLNVKKK